MSDQRLLVTFSGGGHRAAALALGLSLGLASTGTLSATEAIASVSGGSITNARLGLLPGLRTMGYDDLAADLEPLAEHLSKRGSINFTVKGLLLTSFLVSAIAWLVPMWIIWIDSGSSSYGEVAAIALAVVVTAAIFASYGYFLAPAWAKVTWAFLFSEGGSWRNRSISKLRDLSSDPKHIICATDLKGASHVFFTSEGVSSPVYGTANDDSSRDFVIAQAVAASAAFPPVFPPIRIRTKTLGFDHTTTYVGKHLVLLDGGVYDNLAAEWLLGEISRGHSDERLLRFICLDASTPDVWKARTNRLAAYSRVVSVIQRSNARTRTALLEVSAKYEEVTGAVVRLTETPTELAARLKASSPEAAERLDAILPNAASQVGSWTAVEWSTYRERMQSTKTVLSRLGISRTSELIYHGYCLGVVASCALFDVGPPSVKGFHDMRISLGLAPSS